MPQTNYPEYRDYLNELMKKASKEIAGPLSGFRDMRRKTMIDGKLDFKTKELVAIGIAISVRCDGCIAYHVKNALDAGLTTIVRTVLIGILEHDAAGFFRRLDGAGQ